MNEVLKSFCEKNTNPNGLMILPMPTGSGKTYSVRKYISELMERYPKRKIFFISSQKKNIDDPYKELLEDLPDEFKQRVYRIKSNADALVEAKINHLDLPQEIVNSEEYKRVEACLCKREISILTSEEISNIELSFRKRLIKYCKKFYKEHGLQKNSKRNYDKRLSFFQKNGELHFIAQIYPQCLFRDHSCQVLVMTMDKFISPFVTFVESPFSFKDNKEALKDAIIFIDEFDATKDTILNNIISNIKPVDVFRLFRDIHTALTQCHPPQYVTSICEKQIAYCKQIYEDIYQKYKLACCIKLVGVDNPDKCFLFHDSGFRHINGDENQIKYKYNSEKESIELYSGQNTPDCDGNIEEMLGCVEYAIQEFVHLCGDIGLSYYKSQMKDDLNMPLSDCRQSVMDSFHLSKGTIALIENIINSYISGGVRSFECGRTDSRIYTHGFSFYRFEDATEHNENTLLAKYEMRQSPESIMVSIASNAKVIGMSATAGVETLIANYDMEYIKWRLGECYYELSDVDIDRLRKQYEESVKNYERINVEVEVTRNPNELPFLDSPTGLFCKPIDRPDYWGNLVGEANANNIRKLFSETDAFQEKRCWKIASVYKSFIEDQNLHSILIFSNAMLNQPLIQKIFKEVFVASTGSDKKYQPNDIFFISSSELDATKKKMKKCMESGRKTVVISTYKTIGSGQNLQYNIPNGLEGSVRCINDYPQRKEKDIDAIYLETPTHVIMNVSNPDEIEDDNATIARLKYIFILESMADPYNAEISFKDKYKQISKALFNDKKKERDPIRDTLSYFNAVGITLIQSVGRICRSNMKNKKVKIFVDSEIRSQFNKSIINDKKMLFNKEFIELAKKIVGDDSPEKQKTLKQTIEERESTIATNAAIKINSSIAKNFNVNFTDKRLKDFYIELGYFVLKFPTACAKELKLSKFWPLYNTLNSINNAIYYKQEGDFKRVNISFTPQTGYSSVSEGDVQLEDLFHAVPGLKEYFIENGYATSFEPNECIMTPPLFQNIYKGRLGEAVGKYVIENIAEIETEELPLNQFEILDSKLKGSKVFIDYKYWKESTEFNFKDYVDKMLDKLKACADEGSVVLVINVRPIFGQYNPKPEHKDGYTLYEIPSIFEKTGDSSWRPSQSVIDLIKHLYDGNRTNSEL